MWNDIANATWQTIYMVFVSGVLSAIGGIVIGTLLATTKKGHILQNMLLFRCLSIIVNIGRSIPFIILMVAIIPFTRLVAGSSIGTSAAIVPLTVSAVPFVARLTESTLDKVSTGLIEAALAMGATPWQIITKFLLPEALPGIINGITVTFIVLVGYSAMAGAIGGGGLGDLAIRYGYQRFQSGVMFITVVILLLLVQIIQIMGDYIAKRLNKGGTLS